MLFSASLVLAQDRAIRVRKRGDDANLKTSRRVALVIGNSNYKSAPLRNPANDAKALAEVLKESGFQVDLLIDANPRKMDRAIRTFGKKLARGGVGLFFYAGHGMQVKGINYLIPIGTNIEAEDEVKYEAVDANRILSKMSSAQNDLNLVFLDACRNNPFKRSFRSAAKGLAPMDAPKGAMVSFATAPGNVAADGSGKHSPFTAHLLKQMRVPGLEVGQMMRRVRRGVQQETGGKQTPWELSSMTGNFYFFPATKKIIAKAALPVAVKPGPVATAPPRSMDEEEEFWQAVKGSKAVEDLQSYLEAYPKGRFAGIARVKIRQLKRKSAPKPVAVAPPKPAPPPRVTYPRRITGISRVREVYQGKWSWTVKSNGATGWSVNRADGYVRAWMARNKWEAVGEWWATEQGLCTRYRKFRKGQTHCFTLTEVAPNKFITKNVVNGAEVILRKLNSFSQGTVPSKISRPRVTYPRRITGRSRLRSMFPGKWSWTVKSNGATGWGEYKENGDARTWMANKWEAKGQWWATNQGTCTRYRKFRKGRTNCFTLTEVVPNKFISKNNVTGSEVILRKIE